MRSHEFGGPVCLLASDTRGLCGPCSVVAADVRDPAQSGRWSGVLDWSNLNELISCDQDECDPGPGFIAIHAVHLPDAKILMFSEEREQYIWDTVTGQFEHVPAIIEKKGCAFEPAVDCVTGDDCIDYCATYDNEKCDAPNVDLSCQEITFEPDLFCAGHILDSDGDVVMSGGNITGSPSGGGYRSVFRFNQTDGWSNLSVSLSRWRWYPTLTALDSRRVLSFGGTVSSVAEPTSADALEIFTKSSPITYWPSSPFDVGSNVGTIGVQYPFMFLLPWSDVPGGPFVFYAGAEGFSGSYLNTYVLSTTSAPFWNTNAPIPSGIPGGSAVMYQPGMILKSGGCTSFSSFCEATDLAETIDLSVPDPGAQWESTCPMIEPRHFHTLTLLPDGTVLATGGNRRGNGLNIGTCGEFQEGQPVYLCETDIDCTTKRCLGSATQSCDEDADCGGAGPCSNLPSGQESCVSWNNANFATKCAELWDPNDGIGRWKPLCCQQKERMYHSVALLLPDGRVLTAGGGNRDGLVDQRNAEIFSPPYLFKGSRPVIVTSPGQVGYGQNFTVNVASESPVDRVTLTKLASITHQFDMGQNFVELSFDSNNEFTLTVEAPQDSLHAPPGWYMLWALSNGVPSKSEYVLLR